MEHKSNEIDKSNESDEFIEENLNDGVYDDDIVNSTYTYYIKYNDWDTLESEMRNKVDEVRDWSDSDIHEFLVHLKERMQSLQNERSGISNSLENEGWFCPNSMRMRFWEYYKKSMQIGGYSDQRIRRIHKTSSDIVNYLCNPRNKPLDNDYTKFTKKGLVYGNVQSGKTANIAGVISMYASCGCSFVVVLSGVTNNLRKQTQERLRRDLQLDNTHWRLLTSSSDKIGKDAQAIESLRSGDTAIGVFKKNPAALKSLIKYCKKVSDKSFWKNNQVLVIDDECDQYSPNVKMHDEDSDEEYEHSTINKLILELLGLFKRVCYIGYTATPFANVLNEGPGSNTLYPRDFIYSLPLDKLYYGTEKIFGRDDVEPGDEETLDALNYINDVEAEVLQKGIATQVPSSLMDAIDYFIMATACRHKRGAADKHSTMLIHVDLKTAIHSSTSQLVQEYIAQIKDSFGNGGLVEDRFKAIWAEQKGRVTADEVCSLFPGSKSDDYLIFDAEELQDEVSVVLSKLEVIVDNSAVPLESRLVYEDENPRVCIVIGGNTLSRGLTLEGLIVSYFTRSSRTYDTLLQMGRWFGFRRGYEDIARIWTTHSLAENYAFLASVENEIRQEIEDHAFGMSPAEYAIRIRTHPRMQITRRLAMQDAYRTYINYSATYCETMFLNRTDTKIIEDNIIATKDLVRAIGKSPTKRNDAFLFEDVDVACILQYVKSYSFAQRTRDCNQRALLENINKENEKGLLQKWMVAVRSNVNGEAIELGESLRCNLVSRARKAELKSSEECYLKIHSPKDYILDLDEETFKQVSSGSVSLERQFKERQKYYEKMGRQAPGLLVIYPINKDSRPKNTKNKEFEPLEAKGHLIGLMFVFPIIRDKEMREYMQVELPDTIEIDDEAE